LQCDFKSFTKVNWNPEGGKCGGASTATTLELCDENTICNTKTMKCFVPPAEGEACTVWDEDTGSSIVTRKVCASGLYCDKNTKCVKEGQAGAVCDIAIGDDACGLLLACYTSDATKTEGTCTEYYTLPAGSKNVPTSSLCAVWLGLAYPLDLISDPSVSVGVVILHLLIVFPLAHTTTFLQFGLIYDANECKAADQKTCSVDSDCYGSGDFCCSAEGKCSHVAAACEDDFLVCLRPILFNLTSASFCDHYLVLCSRKRNYHSHWRPVSCFLLYPIIPSPFL
jgi:hypothetical protein